MRKTAPNADESASEERNDSKEKDTADFECQLTVSKNAQGQTLHM